MSELNAYLTRLEAVTVKLESLASHSGPTAATKTIGSSEQQTLPFVAAFAVDVVQSRLKPFIALSQQIGGLVQEQVKNT